MSACAKKITEKRISMPISKYFSGHGREVMSDMKDKHGDEAGEREFYATANARNQTPDKKKTRSTGKGLSARVMEKHGNQPGMWRDT